MKKIKEKTILTLIAYILFSLGIYLAIIYPTLTKPKPLAKSAVPSLSISSMNDVNNLFTKLGKDWGENPLKPNVNDYTFGQRDPM